MKTIRSSEFQGILDRKPNWFIRWGIYIITIFLGGFFLISIYTTYTFHIPAKIFNNNYSIFTIKSSAAEKIKRSPNLSIIFYHDDFPCDTLQVKLISSKKFSADSNLIVLQMKKIREDKIIQFDKNASILSSQSIYKYLTGN